MGNNRDPRIENIIPESKIERSQKLVGPNEIPEVVTEVTLRNIEKLDPHQPINSAKKQVAEGISSEAKRGNEMKQFWKL